MFYTTLNRIKCNNPCTDGWKKLLVALNKTEADDEQLSLLFVLDSNGLDDAIWSLRAVDDCPEIRLFAVRCARQVQHLIKNANYSYALDIAELHAVGEATDDELKSAWAVAGATTWAVGDAAGAVGDAASDWVRETATTALGVASAAAAAVMVAAEEATWEEKDAAFGAAWNASRVAEIEAQKQDFIAIFCI